MAQAGWMAAESLGALLARTRISQGKSQLRVAELLCAASGAPTVTRHEVSRWEREQRVPSGHWLRWLAVVLDLPIDDLERAAAVTRLGRGAATDRGGWVTGPDRDWAVGASGLPGAARPDVPAMPPPGGWAVAELRELDDQVGGADLAGLVNAVLRAELATARSAGAEPASERMVRLAELSQLAGWVNADAGDAAAARAAHRLGLRAAKAAGDRALIGHLLGGAAHLTADPGRALALARAGAGEVAHAGSATARALLLHRVAYAAARAGDRSGCDRALAAADRMYGRRRPDQDPTWVYWLTEAEFTAMTGRCHAVLGRSRMAVPLLTHALETIRQPRSAAIYRGWLAQVHLAARDTETSAQLATDALLDAVRAGSVRAATRVRALHGRLAGVGAGPAVRRYLGVASGALGYLADATGPDPLRPSRSCRAKPLPA